MKSAPRRFKYVKLGEDRRSLEVSLANRLIYSMGKDPVSATTRDWFNTTAYVVRERLVERWIETMRAYQRADAKRVYYLSLEFLTGRLLLNSLLNLGLYDQCRDALATLGIELDEILELEEDAGLGNGGLGRLAACFLDSMASLALPGYGYGIRYEYGMFWQRIENGRQIETPDNWLRYGNPWEFPRPEVLFPVRFGGRTVDKDDGKGGSTCRWVDTDDVMAMAFDTPVPGHATSTVNNLRLWSARASREFDLQYLNEGNYIKAVEQKNASETLSKVLYPDDTTEMGRELRLKQQYFFVSASLQDIVQRFLADSPHFERFPDQVAIQLNDTHPAIAIPELMRLLIDVHGVGWDQAWDLTQRTFGYTNHTLMPEALETWPVSLFEQLLPRHLGLIYQINERFLADVRRQFPGDPDRVRRLSLVDEHGGRRVRMAHLALVGSHRVNGVSRIHTDLLKTTIFADFEALYPQRIVNITNGVTPRRWLRQANGSLSSLITEQIGDQWAKDLSQLTRLKPLAADKDFQQRFLTVKLGQKTALAGVIKMRLGLQIDPASMFDVQIKRIHEYKRQLLNLLRVIGHYNRIRSGETELVPRTVIFSGKAAPAYAAAKQIIHLIHAVADVVNRDPVAGRLLKVVFVPNYSVSTAERIIPACELSEQISIAGTEASGTGNMKCAINGALTIGTLDGANVEMREEVGPENIFIFGMTAEEVVARRARGYNPWEVYETNPELRQTLDMIAQGFFSPDEPQHFRPIVDSLTAHGDRFMVLADYAAYVQCQARVDALYRSPHEWARRAILNLAGMGHFSSDRTVLEYADKIWNLHPISAEPQFLAGQAPGSAPVRERIAARRRSSVSA